MITQTPPLPLDYCMLRCKFGTAIEIGTYYGGWTRYLANSFENVVTFQTMQQHRLNDFAWTQHEHAGVQRVWADRMREQLPVQYQGPYDFNFLVDNIKDMDNVTCLLTNSPPRIPWYLRYDLCVIDITRSPDENLRQYMFWRDYANQDGILLIGIHCPADYDGWTITEEQFLSQITEPWHFVPDVIGRWICVNL